MKRCTQCRRDYYDDSLSYCLDAAVALVDGPSTADEPATAIFQGTAPSSGSALTKSTPKSGPKLSVPTAVLIPVVSILVVAVVVFAVYEFKVKKGAPGPSAKK